jgi:drug/metabolite transporter superfamily protein YnfA
MNIGGLLVVAVGLFTFGGGYYQWPWFMNNRRARFVATMLSRTGARVFYMLMGALIALFGVFMTFAEIPAT